MNLKIKLAGLAGGAAVAAVAMLSPMSVFAASMTYSPNPTTHGVASTVTSQVVTGTKILSKSFTNLGAGETVCKVTDPCAPADNTTIGSSSVVASWSFLFCGTGTQNFTAKWRTSMSGAPSLSGWTATAHVQNTNSLATVDAWVMQNNTTHNFGIDVPSYPSLTCSGHTATITTTVDGTVGSSTIHVNPPTAGTYSVSETLTYTDNSTDTPSTTETIS
jgi:hypothetical protein